jgi:hypothetical protein
MSKAVVCTGREQEFECDSSVARVTVAAGVAKIGRGAFWRCYGLAGLGFLEGSAVTAIGRAAFAYSGVASLRGMERVRKLGDGVFGYCRSLRSIEGLGCEEMGISCFEGCDLLRSMKGWPASMPVIPACCFHGCTGLSRVDCDLSRVASVEVNFAGHAFVGCTKLLPPELAHPDADPAAVLACLKRKAKGERVRARYAIYASIRQARDQEEEPRTRESPTAFAFALAKLPPDMNRLILEFKLGVVVQG